MAHSVEGRYPFLDHRVIEYCSGLPSNFKIKGLNEKYLLKQLMRGRLPDAVIACVGGGSNAMGIFSDFIEDRDVELVGVEAAGRGMDTDEHGATLQKGRVGILHGARSLVLQTDEGQIEESYSVSAGLDYPGVGPEHAHLQATGRARYVGATDVQALEAFSTLSKSEGILPALEPAHALAYTLERAQRDKPGTILLVNLSGRGDKDLEEVQRHLGSLQGGGT